LFGNCFHGSICGKIFIDIKSSDGKFESRFLKELGTSRAFGSEDERTIEVKHGQEMVKVESIIK
jgi:hypothetical protein